MDSRRRARRWVLAKHRAERPKIQQQFADLKHGLSAVTDEEWENILEVGNLTRKKRRREERTVLVGNRGKTEFENVLDPRQQQSGGFETPAESGGLTNFVEIGQAPDKILSLKLDQLSGTATSLSTTNDSHAPGWIAAACLEEHAGRMVAARKIVKMGCKHCPKSEDVWIEAARLHNTEDTKIVLANAVQHVGQSVKIWLAAAALEESLPATKRVLRKALEHIPNSVRLWKETVNLESSTADARILLARAVEVIPLSVELWLALARLENPEKAKKVLNCARKAVPTSHEIWIAAGRLLEQEAESPTCPPASPKQKAKELELVDKTSEGAVRDLRRHQVLLTRKQWLKEAEKCELEGSPRTCEAIVKATVAMDVEEEDRFDTWVDDAEAAEARGRVGVARTVLGYALRVFPGRRALWRKLMIWIQIFHLHLCLHVLSCVYTVGS
ncbi:LOW QUALITY PROTEIN: hypothetical protein CVT25_001803 [Psilocybe cyanescens]|uniref:PRP1 splicing factor N-terminal domain-containing protein n=1 Tax=Psilocybe cyanescens TaxID=93625 RepID=A0A409X5E7_PSICY|nr:LOW QUALITY PROTEIN: hypothetical protein CVT25_001803 [Psilocybe cyanescens]